MTAGWFLSRVGDICGGCGSRIPAATPSRRLQTGRVRCIDCAQKLLQETPPDGLVAPTPMSMAELSERMESLRPYVERAKQQAPLDFKAAAAGADTDDRHDQGTNHKRRRPAATRR